MDRLPRASPTLPSLPSSLNVEVRRVVRLSSEREPHHSTLNTEPTENGRGDTQPARDLDLDEL